MCWEVRVAAGLPRCVRADPDVDREVSKATACADSTARVCRAVGQAGFVGLPLPICREDVALL